MALVKCKECGKEISNKAKTCPECGAPAKKSMGCGSMGCGTVLVVSLLVIGIIWTMSANAPKSRRGGSTGGTVRMVTMDGTDAEAGLVIQKINVWKDYNDRSKGVAFVANHGETVRMSSQRPDSVMISRDGQIIGWVGKHFIKEFK